MTHHHWKDLDTGRWSHRGPFEAGEEPWFLWAWSHVTPKITRTWESEAFLPPGEEGRPRLIFPFPIICLPMIQFRNYLGEGGSLGPFGLCTVIGSLPGPCPSACTQPALPLPALPHHSRRERTGKERPPHPWAAISVNWKGHLSKTLNYLSSSLQPMGKYEPVR